MTIMEIARKNNITDHTIYRYKAYFESQNKEKEKEKEKENEKRIINIREVHMSSDMTTLCYIEKDSSYLMLHRIKKENDINKDKWIGVGGHFEQDETPEECLIREVREETGLTLNSWKLRGIITFISDKCDTEYMFLYTSDDFSGEIKECDEGKLEWVEKSKVCDLPIWEGDRIFLKLLNTAQECFSLKLCYEGDVLVQAVLDGRRIFNG